MMEKDSIVLDVQGEWTDRKNPPWWSDGSRGYSETVVKYCLRNKRKVAERCIEPDCRKRFMDAETFVIDIDSWVNDDKTAHDIEATWSDMLELKINKPPYKDLIIHGIVSAAPVSVLFLFEDDLETYRYQLFFPGLNDKATKRVNEQYSEVFRDGFTRGYGLASAFLMQLCVLLATENIETTRKIGHTLTNKFKNGTGGITYIKAPHGGSGSEEEGNGVTCRPHLRRGHIRRQHYGAGNSLIKKIWVPPCFVNGKPEIPRDAYAEKGIWI